MISPATFDTAQALNRLLLVSELLQRSTGPVCAGSLAITLAERTNRIWSKRTVLRDLRLLHCRGLVERIGIGMGRRSATVTWRWSGSQNIRPTT